MYPTHMNQVPMQQQQQHYHPTHQLSPTDPSLYAARNHGMPGPARVVSQSPLQYGMGPDQSQLHYGVGPDSSRPASVGMVDPQQQFQQHVQPQLGGQQIAPQYSANDVVESLKEAQRQAQEQEIKAKIQLIKQRQDLSDFEKQAYLKSLKYYQQQQQEAALEKKTSLSAGEILNEASQVLGPTEIDVHPSHINQFGDVDTAEFSKPSTQTEQKKSPGFGKANPKVTSVKTSRSGAQQFASRPNLVSIPKAPVTKAYHPRHYSQEPVQPTQIGQQTPLTGSDSQHPIEVVEEYHTSKPAEKQHSGNVPTVGKMKATGKKGPAETKNVSSQQVSGNSVAKQREPLKVVRTEHPGYVALTIKYDEEAQTEAKKPSSKKKIPEKPREDKEAWQYCELCKIRFSHKKHYEVHCSGMLHVQKKNEAKKLENELAKVFDDKPDKIVTPVTYQAVEKHIQKTTGVTSKMVDGGKPGERRRTLSVESLSDTELFGDESEQPNGGKTCIHSCKLCNIERFNSDTSFRTHLSSYQHRKKYLQKQSELGFDKFFEVFGKLQYTGSMDVTSRGSDLMSHMDLMVYRSGMLNKLECRLCGVKCGVMSSWKQHVSGKKHTRKCAEEFHSHGRETYISMNGDIPIPERARFHSFVDTLEKELGSKPKKIQSSSAEKPQAPTEKREPEVQKSADSMGEVRQIPNLAKTQEQQQETESAEKKTKEEVEEEEKVKRLKEEKLKRIKQMDDQIKQVKEQLEAKTRISNAVFQQHRSLAQLSGLTQGAGMLPGAMMQGNLMMLNENQLIAAARAKAQAQGMLPQSQQMPLTEQMQLLGSTVPQQISVKPTNNAAELHSQLQKQLLGAEIVPVSQPGDLQRAYGQQHLLQQAQAVKFVQQQQQQQLQQLQQADPGMRQQLPPQGAPEVIQPQQTQAPVNPQDGRLAVTPQQGPSGQQVYDYGHGRDKAVDKHVEPETRAPPRREENFPDWKDSSTVQQQKNNKPEIKGNRIPEQDQRYPRSDYKEKSRDHSNPSDLRQEWEKKKTDIASWDAPPRRQDVYKDDDYRKRGTPDAEVRGDKRGMDKEMQRGRRSKSPRTHSSRERSQEQSREHGDWSKSDRKDDYYDRKERERDKMASDDRRSNSMRKDDSPDYRRKDTRYEDKRYEDKRDTRDRREDTAKYRERTDSQDRTTRRDDLYSRDNSRLTRRSRERSRSREQRSRSYERSPERKREERRGWDDGKMERKREESTKDKEGSISRSYDRDRLKEIKVHTRIGEGEDHRDLREILDESRRKEPLSSSDLRSTLENRKRPESDQIVITKEHDRKLPVDKSIVVEIASSRHRDAENYRKVYAPGKEDIKDEDLRYQIERKQKEKQHDASWKYEEEWKHPADNSRRPVRESDWKESDRRQDYYKEDQYASKEYDSKRKYPSDGAGYEAEKRGGRRGDVVGGASVVVERGGRSEGKYGHGEEQYYRGHSSSTHSHRDWDEKQARHHEQATEASRSHVEGAETGRRDEWAEDRGRSRRREDRKEYREGVALTHAVEIFTETLQQFLGMLHDKEDRGGRADKDPLAGMSREEVDAVLQVQQMTGIADVSIAAKAMHVFSQMDPVMIQTIGMLGPDTIQELTSGNPDALKRIPNYEEIVDGIVKGKINPHKMQDTMHKYGFGSRGSHHPSSEREERRGASGYSDRQGKRPYTATEDEYGQKKGRY